MPLALLLLAGAATGGAASAVGLAEPSAAAPEPVPAAAQGGDDVVDGEPDPDQDDRAAGEALDEATAVEMASMTGDRVEVMSRRTPWSQTFARPDGLMEWEASVVPQFARDEDGTWRDVDTTLHQEADGSVRPAATVFPVVFSGGGSGPLATLADGENELSISWPLGLLPEPVLQGSTAIYRSVLPDVDLHVTATPDGISEVLVVHTPRAAANPAVQQLRLDLDTQGLEVTENGAGGLTAVDSSGEEVFAAPTPLMWDSRQDEDAVIAGGEMAQLYAAMGEPAAVARPSRASGPAAGARVEPMRAGLAGGQLRLLADESLLADPELEYPIFLDPTWTGGLRHGEWSMAWSKYPNSSFWKNDRALNNGSTKGTAGVGRVRDCGGCSQYKIRSFFRMNTRPMWGKEILNAKFRIHQRWSWTCSPSSRARVWRTSIIKSSHTWNNQPSWRSSLDSSPANHKYGGGSGCSGPGNVTFTVTPA